MEIIKHAHNKFNVAEVTIWTVAIVMGEVDTAMEDMEI